MFFVADIPPSTEYILVIYAANMKGRSSSVVIKGSTDAAPRSEQGLEMLAFFKGFCSFMSYIAFRNVVIFARK